ncbi:MAG: tautomerase family protein [Oscillospiraceae bacterium]|nr:tautomerase family protein [Oscillospiraceae bacterium]
MPHIALKMLEGRTEAQKQEAAKKLVAALCEALGCGDHYITMTIEDFNAEEWQDVFANDIEGKANALYKKPSYDPKSLL